MTLVADPGSSPAPPDAPDPRGSAFARGGFAGPVPVFSARECRRIAAYLARPDLPAAPDWGKGRAVHERFLYDLATRPAILTLVEALIGKDVVLWGASAVRRGPGAIHPWHSDIESSAPDGKFVTAWIGIEHTSRDSALQMITHSHLLGKTVQQARQERGIPRDRATPEAMLEIARATECDADLMQPDMTDGDALFFDGRLWHGSDNSRQQGERTALLLQYAAADQPVRIPDLTQLDWPFRQLETPRPPVILVSGSDGQRVNRLVPAPPPLAAGRSMIATAIHPFDLPYASPTKEWSAFPAFRGPTRTLSEMACHASVLAAGHSPHPPHAHREEELLIPLHGEVELRIASSAEDLSPRVERIMPGTFVYYPAGQYHTIRNPGAEPVGYLMFKWFAPAAGSAAPLPTQIVQYGSITAPPDAASFWTYNLFEGPTACLGKLHAHLTTVQPGGGYAPHVDAHDVAIVLLSGEIETLGQRVNPLSVVYCSAGEVHGMQNVGTKPALYLVFEFHAPGATPIEAVPDPRATIVQHAIRLGKRLARPLWWRAKLMMKR